MLTQSAATAPSPTQRRCPTDSATTHARACAERPVSVQVERGRKTWEGVWQTSGEVTNSSAGGERAAPAGPYTTQRSGRSGQKRRAASSRAQHAYAAAIMSVFLNVSFFLKV